MSNKGLTFIVIILIILCGVTFGAFYLKTHPENSLSQKVFGNKVVATNTNTDENLASPFGNDTNNQNDASNQGTTNLNENIVPGTNTPVDTTNTNTVKTDNVSLTPVSGPNDTVIPNDTTVPKVTTVIPSDTTKPITNVDTTTKTTGTITLTLKKGSKGEQVKILQQYLIDNDYLTGKADGIFGGMTESAVKKFQTEYKLTVDGIVGGKTRSTINELLSTN